MGAKKTPVLFVNQACTCVVSNFIPKSFRYFILNPVILSEKNKFGKFFAGGRWIRRGKKSKVKTDEDDGEEESYAERMGTGGKAG